MILVNELYSRYDECFRVLWTDHRNDLVACIAIDDDKGMPGLTSLEDLESLIGEGVVTKSDSDPYSGWPLEPSLSKALKEKRDRNWLLIESLVRSEPDIFVPDRRIRLLRDKRGETGVSLATLYKLLRRYWQRGMCKNALLPDYRNCGSRGQPKKAGQAKRGRPSVDPTHIRGINIDEEARENIRISLKRHYARRTDEHRPDQRKNTLAFAHGQMLKQFYSDFNHETGKPELRSEYPLLATYRYWARRLLDLEARKRSLLGATNYEKDYRPILGTSNTQVLGPGSRYQCDATIGDIYLVSRLRRHQIVGRPTIYVVADVFSRMIVGLYVGLESASWTGAMAALANTASDKVAYCKEYGIEIRDDEWPCAYLPSAILADRAELLSRNSDRLVTELGVTVENAAPYRADWKGIVEKKFDTIQAEFGEYADGYVHKDFRTRTGRDYRLDAKLDIHQFTKVMILLVLNHNNRHRIRGYDFEQEMVRDDVPPIALDIWNWGIRNRSGSFKKRDEKEVKVALMPQGKGLVTRRGIVFHNCHYDLGPAVDEGWYVKAKDRSWYVTLSYDPRDMTQVYYRPEGGGFHVARMTDKSRAYFGMSLKEILQVQYLAARRDHTDRPENLQSRLALEAALGEVTAEADEMAPTHFGSKASRLANMRDNKEQEARKLRRDEAFDLSDGPRDESGNVADLRTGETLNEDYRYPPRRQQYQPGPRDAER